MICEMTSPDEDDTMQEWLSSFAVCSVGNVTIMVGGLGECIGESGGGAR